MELGLFVTFLVGLIGATLRVATPLIFATIGEVSDVLREVFGVHRPAG